MQISFENIQSDMLNLLEEKGIGYKKFKRAVKTYPGRVQVEYLQETKDLDDIFGLWNENFVWSFLDVTLLKHLVNRFGSDELKDTMRQYTKQLTEFRKRTTVYNLIKVWPSIKPPHNYDKCEEVVATLRENPEICTLEKLDALRKHACDKLKGYDLSEAALVLFRVGSGNITWIAHKNIVPRFKEEFNECIATGEFFNENSISKVKLDGRVFMPKEGVGYYIHTTLQ